MNVYHEKLTILGYPHFGINRKKCQNTSMVTDICIPNIECVVFLCVKNTLSSSSDFTVCLCFRCINIHLRGAGKSRFVKLQLLQNVVEFCIGDLSRVGA